MSYEYPFVYFRSFGVKYSLICFCFFVGIMTIKYVVNMNRYRVKFIYCRSNTIVIILSYILLTPFYWWNSLSNSPNDILISICKSILSAEYIFIVFLAIIIVYCIIIYSNVDTYFKVLIFIITVITYIDILSVMVTRQVPFIKWYNILLFLTLGIFLWFANNIRFENIEEKKDELGNVYCYSAIDCYDDLFIQRKWQVEELKSLINNHSSFEPFSICVSGEWGKGKTSFVNAVLDEIHNDKECQHKIIRINTMDIDNVESLLLYLFERIKNELKREGYYVGISSEIHDYISSIIEIVSNEKIKFNILKGIFREKKDYRESKKDIENMLQQMLGKSKLIIIIDDIERCETDKIIQFINFIKEIATFKNCVVIFLVDYDQLKGIFKERPIKYFDKYFNYRINLLNVNYIQIISHFIEKNKYSFKLSQNIQISVIDEIDSLISSINKKIVKLEEEKNKNKYSSNNKDINNELDLKIMELNNIITLIKDKLDNPRSVLKLLAYIQEKCILVHDEIILKNKDVHVVEQYLHNVEAKKNIVIISIIRTIIPESYEKMQSLSFTGYVDFLCDRNSEKDTNDKIIMCLVSGIWYVDYHILIYREYKHDEMIKFIACLFEMPSDLYKIMNSFTSYDEKYITMLIHDRFDEINIDFAELFVIIVKNFAYKNCKTGFTLLEKLFKNITHDNINHNKAFNIFHTNRGNERWFSPRLNVMKLFYSIICDENIVFDNIEEQERQFNNVCLNYITIALNNIVRVLCYHFDENSTGFKIVNSTIEKIFQNRTIDCSLDLFCNELDAYFTNEEKNNIKKIESYIKVCEEELDNIGFMKMEDIRNEVENAFLQVEEFKYMYKIVDFLNEKSSYIKNIDSQNISLEDLQSKIDWYMEILKDNESTLFKTLNVDIMINIIKQVKEISRDCILPNDLIQNINNLITSFNVHKQFEVSYYRKIVIDIIRKQENLDEF